MPRKPDVYPALQSPEDMATLDETLRRAGSLALIIGGVLVVGIEELKSLKNPVPPMQ